MAIEDNGNRRNIGIDELPTNHPIYDIGIETMMRMRPLIMEARCLLWNGPASYFEKSDFAYGTIEIMNMFVEAQGITIVGGGHTKRTIQSEGEGRSSKS